MNTTTLDTLVQSNELLIRHSTALREELTFVHARQQVMLAALSVLCAEHPNRDVLETRVRARVDQLPLVSRSAPTPARTNAPDGHIHALSVLFPFDG